MKHARKGAALLLALCLMASTALAAGVNDSGVFLKQASNSTCTLVSSVMMLRRHAILDGDPDWARMTESSVKGTAWVSNSGLRFNFTYAGMSVTTIGSKTMNNFGSLDEKKSYLRSMLDQHPEGIVVYNHSKPHAVLLTDYSGDTFYCADPAGKASSGRIQLSNCTIPGSGQDTKLGNVNQIWYVKSGTSDGAKSGNTTANVSAAPTDVRLSTDKQVYMLGETVHFSLSSKGAESHYLGVDIGDRRVWSENPSDFWNSYFTPNEAADYEAYFSAYMGSQMTNSNLVHFTVVDPHPSTCAVAVNYHKDGQFLYTDTQYPPYGAEYNYYIVDHIRENDLVLVAMDDGSWDGGSVLHFPSITRDTQVNLFFESREPEYVANISFYIDDQLVGQETVPGGTAGEGANTYTIPYFGAYDRLECEMDRSGRVQRLTGACNRRAGPGCQYRPARLHRGV